MSKPITGVLYAGRFYPDERAGSRPGVFKAKCPYKESEIQNYWKLREYEREKIRSSHLVKRQLPNPYCSGCKDKFQQQCVYQDASPFVPFDKSCFNCFHCLKVLHLCRCQCFCRTCQLAKIIGCTCPLCSCTCGECLSCRNKLTKRKTQCIKEKLLEKFQTDEINDIYRHNFRETLHKLIQEKLRLQEALINVNTQQERAQIKHKLYLNHNLIKDCEKLAKAENLDTPSTKLFLNTPKPEKHPLSTSFFDENDFDINQISPSSSSSNPQPSPPPIKHQNKKYSSQAKAKITSLPKTQQKQLKHLFSTNALSNFNSGSDIIKLLSPSFLSQNQSDLNYQGEIIEPEIIFGTKILSFEDHTEIYEKIRKIYQSFQFSSFEKNVIYGLVLYFAFYEPNSLMDYIKVNRTFQNQNMQFRLPFAPVHGPPFCLILLENKPICNVGVPFFGEKAMLPRVKKSKKIGKFELEVEFDSSKVTRGFVNILVELGKYCSQIK